MASASLRLSDVHLFLDASAYQCCSTEIALLLCDMCFKQFPRSASVMIAPYTGFRLYVVLLIYNFAGQQML